MNEADTEHAPEASAIAKSILRLQTLGRYVKLNLNHTASRQVDCDAFSKMLLYIPDVFQSAPDLRAGLNDQQKKDIFSRLFTLEKQLLAHSSAFNKEADELSKVITEELFTLRNAVMALPESCDLSELYVFGAE